LKCIQTIGFPLMHRTSSCKKSAPRLSTHDQNLESLEAQLLGFVAGESASQHRNTPKSGIGDWRQNKCLLFKIHRSSKSTSKIMKCAWKFILCTTQARRVPRKNGRQLRPKSCWERQNYDFASKCGRIVTDKRFLTFFLFFVCRVNVTVKRHN
jgi:hypothetical protein